MDIQLEWHGPFVLIPKAGFRCVFEEPTSAHHGLYLWTIEKNSEYRIYYVGETKRAFSKRLKEDLQWHLAGNDKVIFDPNSFAQGMKVPLIEPTFLEFLSDYSRLSSVVFSLCGLYRIFLAPLNSAEDGTRKWIEAGVIRALWSADGEISEFLSNSQLINPSPIPFKVTMNAPVRFQGLGSEISC